MNAQNLPSPADHARAIENDPGKDSRPHQAKSAAPGATDKPLQGNLDPTWPTTGAPSYTMDQFSVRAGISKYSVARRIKDGTIRATRIGRLIRIPAVEVDRLLG